MNNPLFLHRFKVNHEFPGSYAFILESGTAANNTFEAIFLHVHTVCIYDPFVYLTHVL